MRKATHKHRLKDFNCFSYLVTDKGVFADINGEWIRSSVELRELEPIVAPEPSKKDQVLIGEDKSNGSLIVFASMADAVNSGYCSDLIGRCLRGVQKKHKGCVWRLVA